MLRHFQRTLATAGKSAQTHRILTFNGEIPGCQPAPGAVASCWGLAWPRGRGGHVADLSSQAKSIFFHPVSPAFFHSGDGIGPEIVAAGRRAIDATGVRIDWVPMEMVSGEEFVELLSRLLNNYLSSVLPFIPALYLFPHRGTYPLACFWNP